MAAWEMTPKALREVVRDHGGYQYAPELNDVLRLQCKGIVELKNLEPYTGLRALYLEANAIEDLEPLAALPELRNLFLGKNMLDDLTPLAPLKQLHSLDVSENYLESLDGVEELHSLATLTAAKNRIKKVEGIEALKGCAKLVSLDLQDNKLEDPAAIELLAALPLSLLKLQGNPVVSATKAYRKTLLAKMGETLNYLDDMPAFPKDKRLAVAYLRGGLDEERAERDRIKAEEKETRERHRRAFDEMVERARAEAARPDFQPDPDARFRFKSAEAIEEMQLLESGMSEFEVQEFLKKRAAEAERLAREGEARARGELLDDEEPVAEAVVAAPEETPTEADDAESVGSDRSYVMVDQEDCDGASPDELSPSGGAAPAAVIQVDADEVEAGEEERRPRPSEALAAGGALQAGIEARAAERASQRKADAEAFAEAEAACATQQWEMRQARQQLAATEAAAQARRESGADSDAVPAITFTRKSPMLYGTARWKDLWSAAKVIGEKQADEEPEEQVGAESKEADEAGEALQPAVKAEAEGGDDEDSDDDEDFDDEHDPFERYHSTTAVGGRPYTPSGGAPPHEVASGNPVVEEILDEYYYDDQEDQQEEFQGQEDDEQAGTAQVKREDGSATTTPRDVLLVEEAQDADGDSDDLDELD